MALGLAAFCLVSVFGLLTVGLMRSQSSLEQTGAADMATSIVSDLRATPTPSTTLPTLSPITTSNIYKIDLTSSSQQTLFLREDGTTNKDGGTGINVDADTMQHPLYRASVTMYPSANTSSVTMVRIFITWPAMADPVATAAPSKYSGSYEVVTALDRN